MQNPQVKEALYTEACQIFILNESFLYENCRRIAYLENVAHSRKVLIRVKEIACKLRVKIKADIVCACGSVIFMRLEGEEQGGFTVIYGFGWLTRYTYLNFSVLNVKYLRALMYVQGR